MEHRGPYVRQPNGDINCEVLNPVHGWVPFTASASDPWPPGRDLFAAIEADETVEGDD